MIVIIDNGHGENTPGKRSPKGMLSEGTALHEYEFNRDIVCRMKPLLEAAKIEYHILVPELIDISLPERCERANEIFAKRPDAFLNSIHANAGGGTGWEAFTSVGDTPADPIATIIYDTAAKSLPHWKLRKDEIDGDPDKESQFYILKHTKCPSVLTENGFMDNEKDLAYLISDEGRQAIAEMHVQAYINVRNQINSYK